LSFIPRWMLMYFSAGSFFFWISPCVWPNSGLLWCCVSLYFTDNSINCVLHKRLADILNIANTQKTRVQGKSRA
jgi:hypothetical protein